MISALPFSSISKRKTCDDKGLINKVFSLVENNSELWTKSGGPMYQMILYQAKAMRPVIEQSLCLLINAKTEKEFNQIITQFFGVDEYTLQVYEEMFFHYLRPISEYRKASKIANDLLTFMEENWDSENPLSNYENNKKFLEEMNEKYGSFWISHMDLGGQVLSPRWMAQLEIKNKDIDGLARAIAGAY